MLGATVAISPDQGFAMSAALGYARDDGHNDVFAGTGPMAYAFNRSTSCQNVPIGGSIEVGVRWVGHVEVYVAPQATIVNPVACSH
jgi:hypothetical protein